MKRTVFKSRVKVEYSHTDKMSYVHHSQYLKYYEYARWELFRNLGLSYKDIESSGLIMPVISSRLNYCKPAFYDEILLIKTQVKIEGARIVFNHKILNREKELINYAQIQVVCVNEKTRKLQRLSKSIVDRISNVYRRPNAKTK